MTSRYAESSEIFEDEGVLLEDYRPEELPERESEMESLHMALSPAARGVGANNAFLYGKAGQGKTAAAKTELAELRHHAEEESDHLDLTTLYVSCESHDLSTTFRAAARIYMELTGNERPTGHSTDAVMDMLFEAMNEVGGTIIIVLDEIDTLGSDDRLLYSLPRARAQGYVEDHVYPSIIGISNDLQWRDNLSSKVKSSLYDDQILFSPYDANQLQQILRRRAAKAFKNTELIPLDEVSLTAEEVEESTHGTTQSALVEIDGTGQEYLFRSEVLTADVVPLVSAFAANDKGDARQAIKYLRKAGEIADANNSSRVDEETVREAQAKVEKETVTEAMREMTTQAHLSLASVTVLERAGDTPVRTKPVYGVYQNIADKVNSEKLVQRRMRDHLMELDMQGIINAQKKSAGSIGGPAWHFELQVAVEVAIEVLQELGRFEGIDFNSIRATPDSSISDY
jgi:cell division control protein 6